MQVDTAPFADALRDFQDEMRTRLAPRAITKHVERDKKGLIVAIHEEPEKETA